MAASLMELVRCAEVKTMEKIDWFKKPTGPGSIQKCKYFFEEAQSNMSYGLFVPESYDGSEAVPLVVLLHGMHSSPHEIIRLKGITSEANARGYIVVAPYGYDTKSWYGIKGMCSDRQSEFSEKDVLNVLGIVRQKFAIDSKRIYLMGHSMGGAGTIHLGAVYPHLWAAIAPMSPPIFDRPSYALMHMPMLVVTGESDPVTPVDPIREWVAEAYQSGMHCEYEEISGGTHLFVVNNPKVYTRVFDFFDANVRAR